MPLTSYLFETLEQGLDMTSLEGRARLAEKAVPWLQQLPSGPLQDLVRAELEKRTGVQNAAAAPPRRAQPDAASEAGSAGQRPVRRALQLLLEHPALAQNVSNISQLSSNEQAGVPLLLEVIDYFQAQPEAHTGHLVQSFDGRQEGAWLQQLALSELPLEAEAAAAEFGEIIERLCRSSNRQRVRELQQRAEQLSSAEQAELRQLMQAMQGGDKSP